MGRIYKQSKIDLFIETNIDLTDVTDHEIQYISPSKVKGSFTSVIESDNRTLSHSFVDGEIDEEGVWIFYPYVVFSDTRDAYGEPVKMEVNKIGT